MIRISWYITFAMIIYTSGSKRTRKNVDLSESESAVLKTYINKNVIGKFKDETNSIPMTEFIALTPKC